MNVNQITFAGNAGKDAEGGSTKDGKDWTRFSLCHTYKPKQGDPVSTWVNVKCFGWAAKIGRAVRKGDNVCVQGSLSVSNWKDKEGATRVDVSVMANEVGIVPKVKVDNQNSAPEYPDEEPQF